MNNIKDITKDVVFDWNSAGDMRELIGKKLTIIGVESGTSLFGEWMIANYKLPESDQVKRFFVRGSKCVERLKTVSASNAFPIEATPVKVGHAYDFE